MKNGAFMLMLLAMASLFLNGCGKSSNKDTKELEELNNYKQPPDTDVTTSPEYYFSSFAGTVWRTRTKTALAEMKLYTGRQVMAFVSPKLFDPTDPEYRAIPDTFLSVVTVFPPGAIVRIDRLIQDNGIGSTVWVIASLENETNSQTTNLYLDEEFLANNSFFRGPATLHRWGVNSDYLEAVTNAP
jgi:hypothetical protein